MMAYACAPEYGYYLQTGTTEYKENILILPQRIPIIDHLILSAKRRGSNDKQSDNNYKIWRYRVTTLS